MLTLLLYVLIVGLVAAVLFLLAGAVFGRSEELGPLPEGTTATVLPVEGISGADVRSLRFQQVLRGYKAGEVDWALARLAARIDELQGQLAQARAEAGGNVGASAQPGPVQPPAGPDPR
ncbi:DivIVA domain-containing protein [Nocardia cyriacigeorgica]|uniref:DivIVA domain-containing protein n=1 Tax=Nocardia cyriacigeorgica TaxID=135487 RepID=UPI002456E21F|nr:DivIVA domain-containing protein [Nocardia cyriacigeorgica]